MEIITLTSTNSYGGYDYKFVNPIPDRCICRICHLPSRDAYMTGPCCQGLTICKSCLDHWQITAGNIVCPVCRKEEGGFHQNYPIAREIKSLHIYCMNKEEGCEWEGELNDVNNHLGSSEGCQFEEVKCSNECGKMIQRQCLTVHVETECPCCKVNCQYCHDTGEHQFIEGQHKEECPKLPLPCPNKCEIGSVPRDDMEAHRKECPLEMIQCEYYDVGCEVTMARKDKKEHDDEKMKEENTKHKLADTNTSLANAEEVLIYTSDQLAVALQRISTLEVLLYLATDKAVAKPTSCAVVLESSMGWPDKLVTMVMMSKSGDLRCPVAFKLSEYKAKKRDEIEWCSDSFYTHNKGYKMCLRVYAAGNGYGEDTHLSIFLSLMKGPHDDELTWPLKGEFEMKLLNQVSDSEHQSITVTFDDDTPENCNGRIIEDDKSALEGGWGSSQYIINEDLNKITQTCQFLKDDCLLFQINFDSKA